MSLWLNFSPAWLVVTVRMFAHIIHWLSGKYKTFDQATITDLQIAHALIFGRPIDFANLIFSDMVSKVMKNNRDPIVPYTRFISLLLEDMMEDAYKIDEDSISSPHIGSLIFMNTRADANGGTLTEAMLKVVRSKTPPSSPQYLSFPAHSSKHTDPEVRVSPLEVTDDSI